MKPVIPALAAILLLAACTAQLAAFPSPPPLPTENRPLPPVSELPQVWQPGDWVYAGGSFRYEPGRYVPNTGREHAWAFGHFAGTRDAPVWVAGNWAG